MAFEDYLEDGPTRTDESKDLALYQDIDGNTVIQDNELGDGWLSSSISVNVEDAI